MTDIDRLARPEIRAFRPYQAANYEDGFVRLNANETPWRPPGDASAAGLNRYPEARPVTLTRRLADYYGIAAERVLVTRGTSEAIDLLLRCFCRPGRDDVVISPPTFGMYEVYAQLQGAGIARAPLRAAQDFAFDVDAVLAAWNDRAKLVFVCSPNNPTGNRVATDAITTLAQRLSGRGIVVVDAAYIEFADADPTHELLEFGDNLVVLRTLSKAFGLAGIRCGAALGSPRLIELLGCIMPPYSYPTPCQDAALACLAPQNVAQLAERTTVLRAERERVTEQLRAIPEIVRVWPSQANFVLVRVAQPGALLAKARRAGFLLRDFSYNPDTPDCVRITIGTEEQNDALLEALTSEG